MPSDGTNPAASGAYLPDVDRMEIVVAMRFSFFGLSGWKSDCSHDKELLFARERLELRLQILRSVALASLAAQDDRNFHLFVLTSEDLPHWALTKLDAHCTEMLGKDRFSIAGRPAGPAKKFLRWFLNSRYKSGRVIQMVLDDDDGLASNFIQRLRHEAHQISPEKFALDAGPTFVSFFNGYGLVLGEDAGGTPALYKHRYPYINLGLSMLSTVNGINIFAIDHRKAPKRYGCRNVRGIPMWVRSLHSFNDSRVAVTDRWTLVEDWAKDPDIQDRFQYLTDLRGGITK